MAWQQCCVSLCFISYSWRQSSVPCQSLFAEAEKEDQSLAANLIQVYNQFMEGLGSADKNIDKDRVSIRGKKW